MLHSYLGQGQAYCQLFSATILMASVNSSEVQAERKVCGLKEMVTVVGQPLATTQPKPPQATTGKH